MKLHVLCYYNQQNELRARKEVQASCGVNSVSLIQSPPIPCLLSLFLLHLNCSTVKDAHFLTKSNDVSLIHFILIFLLPLAPLPNDLLDFSLSNFKFHNLMLLSFHSYLFCPSSSLLCWIQVFPLILDSHQISVCFICIFIM